MGPQTGKEEREKGKCREMGLDEAKSGDELRKKTNLLNIIVECEIIEYNRVLLELKLINQIK